MDIVILILIFLICAFLIVLSFWKENAVLLFIGGLTLMLLGFILFDGIRYTDGTIGLSESWEDTNVISLWTGQEYGDDCEATVGEYGMMAPDRLLLHLEEALGAPDYCQIEDSSCANNHARRERSGSGSFDDGVLTQQDGWFGYGMLTDWEGIYNGTILINGSCSADSTPANFSCDDSGTIALWWGSHAIREEWIDNGLCGSSAADPVGMRRILTLSKREGNSEENTTEIMILGAWCYENEGKYYFRLCSGIYGGGDVGNGYWQSLWCTKDYERESAEIKNIFPSDINNQKHYIIRTVGDDEMKIYVDGSPISYSAIIEEVPGSFWFSDLGVDGESCDSDKFVFQISGTMSNIATMEYQDVRNVASYSSFDEVAIWSVEFSDANATNAYNHMYSVTEDRISIWTNTTASYLYVEEKNIWIDGLGLTVVLLGLLITIHAGLELATQGGHKFL